MTKPANNPPQESTPTKPGQALRIVRLVIAVGLCVGIAVFAVLTIKELEAGQAATMLPNDFGAISKTQTFEAIPTQGDSPLGALGGLDPNKYPPILRDNPHPGRFAPFMRADPHTYPYSQTFEGGETWEICSYKVKDANLAAVIAHYGEQAASVGMKQIKHQPTSQALPGGIEAAWSDGRRSLRVTAAPLPTEQPVAPPLKQPTPLEWVVQYSYPAKGQ